MFNDSRYYQIVILSILLTFGISNDIFQLPPWHIPLLMLSTILSQLVACRLLGISFDIKSPLITSLSLSLLLRTNYPIVAVMAGLIATSSKFMVRFGDNKHLFNPSMIALVICTGFAQASWISPGQWGSSAYNILLIGGLATIVVFHARMLDICLTFFGVYFAALLLRTLWLGDDIAILFHYMSSGSLLLFGFFMVTDPKTVPNARAGRVLFATMVALLAFVMQFCMHIPLAMFYALAICSFAIPKIDELFPAPEYSWIKVERCGKA